MTTLNRVAFVVGILLEGSVGLNFNGEHDVLHLILKMLQ